MKTSRKPRFLRALAKAGLTQAAWARSQGISPAHLSLVLNAKRESVTLTNKIDAFIADARRQSRAQDEGGEIETAEEERGGERINPGAWAKALREAQEILNRRARHPEWSEQRAWADRLVSQHRPKFRSVDELSEWLYHEREQWSQGKLHAHEIAEFGEMCLVLWHQYGDPQGSPEAA